MKVDDAAAEGFLKAYDGILESMLGQGIKKTSDEYKNVAAERQELIDDNPVLQE